MKAHLRGIRISYKKANVVAEIIRGKSVIEALNILKVMPTKAAKLIYKVLFSAKSNAETNDNLKMEDLVIKEIIINKGSYQKKFLPSTRGRALPIHKPTCHISVELIKK